MTSCPEPFPCKSWAQQGSVFFQGNMPMMKNSGGGSIGDIGPLELGNTQFLEATLKKARTSSMSSSVASDISTSSEYKKAPGSEREDGHVSSDNIFCS